MRREGADVRVLCFNVAGHWFSPNDPPKIAERMKQIAEKICSLPHPVDIVCIQELYSLSLPWPLSWKSERSDFVEALQKKGGFHHFVTSEQRWVGMDSGLLILSRFAMEEDSVERLVFSSQASKLSSCKGALGVRIRVPNDDHDDGTSLFVCCVHLAWGGQVETSQREELTSFLEKKKERGDVPMLICGDFNGPPPLDHDQCPLCPLGPTHKDSGTYDHAITMNGPQISDGSIHNWELSDHYAIEFKVRTK